MSSAGGGCRRRCVPTRASRRSAPALRCRGRRGGSARGATDRRAPEPPRPARDCRTGERGDVRMSSSSSTGSETRSSPTAPGRGQGRESSRCSPSSVRSLSRDSRAIRRYVVSLPPATLSIPPALRPNTVSRLALTLSPLPAGSTRSPAYEARTRSAATTSGGSAVDASDRIWSTSAGVTATSLGSPSCSTSVVPSRSMSYQGTAKVTRTASCVIVSAAVQSPSRDVSTCAPLLSRTDEPSPGSSRRRTWSTHGPAALTTTRESTAIVLAVDADLRAREASPCRAQRDHLGTVEHARAGLGRRANVLDAQPRIVRRRIRVEGARAKAVETERRHHPRGL